MSTETIKAGDAPLGVTPSQTVGPFYGYALPYDEGPFLVAADHPQAIRVRGRVSDGAGNPISDAILEICLAGGAFGRCPTDADGEYEFRLPRPDGYVAMLVFMRGLLKPVATRVYLTDDPADPLLASVDPERRGTLIATPEDDGVYRFDIHMQGDQETVFLAA
ncbi:MAG TPA: protocatechuate 3,4-dioxygenase subunit alpha [Thermopolyspora sp.]|jgi:protocatechuate 3,4-dioxygenase, alpha subunit